MAKFFKHANAIGMIRDGNPAVEGIVPVGAVDVIEFDELTNADIVAEFAANYSRFSINAGVLARDGVPVSFAPESTDRATKRELKEQLNDRLNECDATITIADATVAAVQPVIDGVDAVTTVPQLRAMVKTLAQRQKQDAQELKSLARNQKRILRMLKGLL